MPLHVTGEAWLPQLVQCLSWTLQSHSACLEGRGQQPQKGTVAIAPAAVARRAASVACGLRDWLGGDSSGLAGKLPVESRGRSCGWPCVPCNWCSSAGITVPVIGGMPVACRDKPALPAPPPSLLRALCQRMLCQCQSAVQRLWVGSRGRADVLQAWEGLGHNMGCPDWLQAEDCAVKRPGYPHPRTPSIPFQCNPVCVSAEIHSSLFRGTWTGLQDLLLLAQGIHACQGLR